MSTRNPNKHYSLRKLKTGTASVAVALTVLGTGLANTTDVKADLSTREHPRVTEAREKALEEVIANMSLDELQQTLAGSYRKNRELEKTIEKKDGEASFLSKVLDETAKKYRESSDKYKQEIGQLKAAAEAEAQTALDALNNKNKQISDLTNENAQLKEAID